MFLTKFWRFNKDLRICLLLLALALIFFILGNLMGDKSIKCKEVGGKWLKKYNECEALNIKKCAEIGGFYNFCASPCRHNDEENIAEACTFQCVGVCEFFRTSK